jgi:hypothetical protein
MKKSKWPLVAGAVVCGAALGSPAHAASFFSADTKHGSFRLASSRQTCEDFAKFQWPESDSPVDRVVISLSDQRLYAYDGRKLVAWSNISSGKTGYETPTGTYAVSQKDVDHHSSLFDNAPMPYFMRLTDAGLGLHAGFLPGYPASHGCIRMPFGMARELYQHVNSGTPVEIISSSIKVALLAHKPKPAAFLSQL